LLISEILLPADHAATYKGCPLLGTPRTDPDEPDSSIRLLPWVFDGEALLGPGMKDTRRGKPAVGQFRHPIPREAILLAAPPERSTPEVTDGTGDSIFAGGGRRI
jgi:hypothetical protein